MADKSIDDIIESYASSLELPIDNPKTIDTIIEFLASGAKWSKEDRENLRKVLSKKTYKRNNPKLMLEIYDVLGGKSNKALAYGIQGFEALGRDPKIIVRLENPDKLVKYFIDTTERLDKLVGLKDVLLTEGHFYALEDKYSTYGEFFKPNKNLAIPLILVANEIAYRLRDVGTRKLTKEEIDAMKPSEVLELAKQWNIRIQTHEAIVLACQVRGKKVVNKEALEALAAYDSLAGTYQAHGFTIDLMEAYAKIKYGVNKPTLGEVPEELKADYGGIRHSISGVDWDQYFRQRWFGTKESELERMGRGRRKELPLEELVKKIIEDPWSLFEKELRILGLNKDMTYEQARVTYRRVMMSQRDTFSRMDIGTSEYNAAMDRAVKCNLAWEKVEKLYMNKPQAAN